MRIRVEVFERQVASVPDFLEGFYHCRPVGGSVEQRSERFERVIGPLLRELLEVHVLRARAEERNPVLWILKQHDVARVEVHAQVDSLWNESQKAIISPGVIR